MAPIYTPADVHGVAVHGSHTLPLDAADATTVVCPRRGRLARVVVTAEASDDGTVTFYDDDSAASGTVLAVIPSTAEVAQSYDIDMPAANGITAVTVADGPAVVVSYSTT